VIRCEGLCGRWCKFPKHVSVEERRTTAVSLGWMAVRVVVSTPREALHRARRIFVREGWLCSACAVQSQ
jgi:hypothetical protein